MRHGLSGELKQQRPSTVAKSLDDGRHDQIAGVASVAGGGGGTLATGRHLRVDEKTPMTNLYRSMLDNVGVRTEKIGDSTGKLDKLFAG